MAITIIPSAYTGGNTHRGFAADGLTDAEVLMRINERMNDTPDGKPWLHNTVGNYTPAPNFRKSHIRGKIFNDSSKRLYPDMKYLVQYENFLTQNYIKALQAQLDISGRKYISGGSRQRYAKLGYATGTLQKTIKARAKTIIRRSTKQGRVLIKYELRPEYRDYGDYIAYGRRAGKLIPYEALVKWLEIKISMGALRVYKKRKGTGDLDRKPKILRIARAISWASTKADKPPVLKEWSSWTGNPNLRSVFKSLIKGKDAYYKSQIRKSIIRNLKTQYGT